MIYTNMINQTTQFCRGLSHKVFQRKWGHEIKSLTEIKQSTARTG